MTVEKMASTSDDTLPAHATQRAASDGDLAVFSAPTTITGQCL